MGFYSQVQIVSEKKAFPLFEEVFKKRNISGVRVSQKGDVHTILLDWVKWYPNFDEVKEVNEICRKLQTDPYDTEDGYGFKLIVLNEDNTTEESYNSGGGNTFSDVEVICAIQNPYFE